MLRYHRSNEDEATIEEEAAWLGRSEEGKERNNIC